MSHTGARRQVAVNEVEQAQQGNGMRHENQGNVVTLPINDAGARLFLLTRLILTFDEGDQDILADLVRAGFTPELIDKLRGMSLVDALRFVASHCGLSLAVDADAVKAQMNTLERMREDRKLYEYFIHAGASPALISRLFNVASDDVRRLRKLIAPQVACGGRPRAPDEPRRTLIEATWKRIRSQEASDRQAMWKLHQEFQDMSMATLENVIRPNTRPFISVSPLPGQRPDASAHAAAA